MRLLLVRHGESTWNVEGRYQGRKDAPLSARGIAQAEALGERLAASEADRPAAIVSSPLSRARGTAEIIARHVNAARVRAGTPPLAIELDDRIVEIAHGEWEGLTKPEIKARWPEMKRAWRDAPETVVFPGGETLADVRTRWRSFAADAGRRPSPLLVATHDVIVRLAVLDARGESLSAFRTMRAENAALTELAVDGGRARVVRINDAEHLAGLRADPSAQAL